LRFFSGRGSGNVYHAQLRPERSHTPLSRGESENLESQIPHAHPFPRLGLVTQAAVAASNGHSRFAMISAAAGYMRLSDAASVSALPS